MISLLNTRTAFNSHEIFNPPISLNKQIQLTFELLLSTAAVLPRRLMYQFEAISFAIFVRVLLIF
jgi:hypothetical protein